jgi:protein-S-isoprenylcysteine O-methyltransferase Ste14
VYLFCQGTRRWRAAQGERERLWYAVVLGAIVALLVNMAAYEMFYWFTPYMYLCLLCGMLAGRLWPDADQ